MAERLHQYEGCIPKTEASIEGIRGEYFYQMHHYQFYGISSRFTAIWASLEILDYGDGSSVAKQVLLDDFYYQLPVSPNCSSRHADVNLPHLLGVAIQRPS